MQGTTTTACAGSLLLRLEVHLVLVETRTVVIFLKEQEFGLTLGRVVQKEALIASFISRSSQGLAASSPWNKSGCVASCCYKGGQDDRNDPRNSTSDACILR